MEAYLNTPFESLCLPIPYGGVWKQIQPQRSITPDVNEYLPLCTSICEASRIEPSSAHGKTFAGLRLCKGADNRQTRTCDHSYHPTAPCMQNP